MTRLFDDFHFARMIAFKIPVLLSFRYDWSLGNVKGSDVCAMAASVVVKVRVLFH